MTFFQQDSAIKPLTKRESAPSPAGFWGENINLEIVASLFVRYQPGQFVVMGHGKVQKA
jgi:hypothetical protein